MGAFVSVKDIGHSVVSYWGRRRNAVKAVACRVRLEGTQIQEG